MPSRIPAFHGFAVTVALAVAVCAGSTSAAAGPSAPAVSYVMKTVEKRDPACKAAPPDCSSIKLQYPEFTRAPTDAARLALNTAVATFVLTSVLGDRLKTTAAVVDDFFRQAATARREVPTMPAWVLEKTVSVEYNAANIVSLDFSDFEFTGGAHPNGWSTLASSSALTGRRLTLKDLLIPGYEPKLNAIAEPIFRKEKELRPTANLEAEGFTFKDGKFRLNNNFMVTAKGLVFYFNSHEIAPYVVGPTELLLPYSLIRRLIKPGGPLAAVGR